MESSTTNSDGEINRSQMPQFQICLGAQFTHHIEIRLLSMIVSNDFTR